jgi:hypothetical protein
MSDTHKLPIDTIRTDGGTQIREKIDDDVVADYAEALTQGETFPPLVVFHRGNDWWLADGFHRLAAYRKLRRTEIQCEVRKGSCRDAILYAVGANAANGLRRTNKDKHRAVATLLNDSQWSEFSDREIADHCHVSHTFVSQQRKQLATVASCDQRTYVRRGKTQSMDTSKIGKSKNGAGRRQPPRATSVKAESRSAEQRGKQAAKDSKDGPEPPAEVAAECQEEAVATEARIEAESPEPMEQMPGDLETSSAPEACRHEMQGVVQRWFEQGLSQEELRSAFEAALEAVSQLDPGEMSGGE